jgi:hypothetical protein
LLPRYLPSVPNDWDVIVLGGYYPQPPVHVAGHVFQPGNCSQVHGYAVSADACRRLLATKDSSRFEDTLNGLVAQKIYSIWPNVVCPTSGDQFVSFRELGIYGPSRLGNQLFQVAATLGAAARHGYRPQLPIWEYAERFDETFDQEAGQSVFASKYIERQFHYVEIPHEPNLDVVGFFQSHRYFAGIEKLIWLYFQPAPAVQEQLAAKKQDLLTRPTVAIHIRHGDYLSMPERFRVLPVEYYRSAMRRFDSRFQFAVFGDDPAWASQVFRRDNIRIISGNSEVVDLFLMAACDHQIIANSSFSWWGAWLNANPDKRVIAPAPWFGPALQHDTSDLLPPGWIGLTA